MTGFFVETGDALRAIRDGRLYLAKGYQNFEAYCQERWGFSRQNASYLCKGAQTWHALRAGFGSDECPLPQSEKQIRPLTRVSTEQAQAAWGDALETHGNSPTGAQVLESVRRVQQRCQWPAGTEAQVVTGEHQGATVAVVAVKNAGALVEARLPSGEQYPFLAGELEAVTIPEVPPKQTAPKRAAVPQAKPPPGPTVEELTDLLREVLTRAGLPSDLSARIKAVVEL